MVQPRCLLVGQMLGMLGGLWHIGDGALWDGTGMGVGNAVAGALNNRITRFDVIREQGGTAAAGRCGCASCYQSSSTGCNIMLA